MKNLKFTLKAWPVIAGATIGLCYLTQSIAGLFGIELKEQQTVEQIRQMGIETWRIFATQGLGALFRNAVSTTFLVNIPLVLVIIPIAEELVFRGLLFRLPTTKMAVFEKTWALAVAVILSSAVFSAAHYLTAPWPNNAFLALFAFGAAQCALYLKTKAIVCPMLNHGLFNLTNFILMFVVPAPQ